MDKQKARTVGRGIFSFILGIIGGIATFIILIMIFFAFGLFGWSDGGDKEYLRRLEISTNVTLVISIVMALVVFIVIIFSFNRKNSNTESTSAKSVKK